MKVYLMRHGESDDGERMDPTRELTPTGKAQARLMGRWLRNQAPKKTVVLESNYRRSQQTAKRVAHRLDAERVRAQEGLLDPDAQPERAWEEIIRAGKDAGAKAIVAVTHGPLVQQLVALSTGASPAMVHFPHAAVAHIDSDTDLMHWLVSPNVVARDQDEQDLVTHNDQPMTAAESELLEAADDLADLLESMRLKPHAGTVAKPKARIMALFRKRWKAQKKAIIEHLKPWMQTHALQEADAETKARLQQAVTGQLNAVAAMHADPTAKEIAAYNAAITQAALGAMRNVSVDLSIEIAREKGTQFVSNYLHLNSLSQLSKEVDGTTKERIADALADTFDRGGTYTDGVRAIEDAFDEMSENRAEMIARTEVNDAYNSAIIESGREIAGAQKQWNLDGEGCPICEDNAAEGPIDIDEDFPSGDDAPTAHPNCDCSLSIVVP